jgi:short-subunit dehydrogenase
VRDWQGKRYWVVGASAGLGRAVAMQLSRLGCHLILSARSEDALRDLAETLPGRADVLAMDVTNDASVACAAEAAGEIDGIVYLAAVYWPMTSATWEADKVTAMMDVNLTGAARVLGQVVPGMVERGRGHVVLTGSLSGYRGLPRSLGYGASKAGAMYLAESMYADLRGSGVDVQLVNPGFVKTRLTDKNGFRMPFIMEPEEAARLYVEHMTGDGFSRNFPRHFGALFRLSTFLPDWAYYRLFG